jgi:hypothetical protein
MLRRVWGRGRIKVRSISTGRKETAAVAMVALIDVGATRRTQEIRIKEQIIKGANLGSELTTALNAHTTQIH